MARDLSERPLITDSGLPGLNGRQVVDAARQHRPDLKVLVMSGYAKNAAIANGFLEPSKASPINERPLAGPDLTVWNDLRRNDRACVLN